MSDSELIEIFDKNNSDESSNRPKLNISSYLGEISDQAFFEGYRMTKETFLRIFHLLNYPIKNRGNFIAPEFELLTLLRYLSTGSFMLISGSLLNVSKSTAHSFIHRSMRLICSLASDWNDFPEDISRLKKRFKSKYSFPDVIGAIDCTHVKMNSTGGNFSEVFRNRKGYFSLNIQAVCGPNLKFYDVVLRWPGSTHDSRIFDNSIINLRP